MILKSGEPDNKFNLNQHRYKKRIVNYMGIPGMGLYKTQRKPNPYEHLTNRGGYMKITWDSYEQAKTNPNASGKTFPIYRIKGIALEGKLKGEEYTTQIFANAKDMVSQVKSFAKGDTVNITVKKNGNYWNPVKFEKVDDYTPNVDKAIAGVTNVNVTNPRFENLKLAIEIMGPKAPKSDATEHLMQCAGLADLIQDYVDKQGAFQFNHATADGIPEVGDEEDVDNKD
jgi:hypothetical protein